MVQILHKVRLHTIVDTATSATLIYIGTAEKGVATSATEWYIKRIDTANGADITSASDSYDKAWDNRASETYT